MENNSNQSGFFSPETQALVAAQVAAGKAKREANRAAELDRVGGPVLTPNEKLLRAIFGVAK